MKIFCCVVFCVLYVLSAEGQNLVPNSSGECHTTCPGNTAYAPYGMQGIKYWNNPTTGNPDVYDTCCSVPREVPNNLMGYQYPKTGNAYMGFSLFYASYEYREYLQVKLLQPLIANECYQVKFYLNLANKRSLYSIGKAGAYLSAVPINQAITTSLAVTPQVVSSGVQLNDTLNWMLVEGSFTASGGEEYLIIGAFGDDVSLDTASFDPSSSYGSYYYIDDICLSACGSSCRAGVDQDTFNICRDESITLSLDGEYVFFDSMGNNISELSYQVNNDTLITVMINDTMSCLTYSDSVWIMLDTNKTSKTNEMEVCENVSTQLTSVRTAHQYQWNPNLHLSCNDCPEPYFDGDSSADYHVEVTDTITNCIYNDSFFVEVMSCDFDYQVFIPNAFSPDDDGVNDKLKVVTIGLADDWKIMIYGRYGKKIFEGKSWDGTYNGQDVLGTVVLYFEGNTSSRYNQLGETSLEGDIISLQMVENVSILR